MQSVLGYYVHVRQCVRRSLYLAHSGLDDGIKAPLGGISVPGDHLLLHFLCEAAHLLRQRENVLVAELGQTGGVDAVNQTSEFVFSHNLALNELYC